MTDSETPEKKGGLWLSVRIGFVLAIVIYLLDILTVVYYSPLYVIPIHFLLTLGVTVSNVVVAFLQAKKNPKDKFARNWRWVSLVILVVLIIGGFFFVQSLFADISGGPYEYSQSETREQILEDLRTGGDKKLSFPSSEVRLQSGDERLLEMGVKNTAPQKLYFRVEFYEISNESGQNVQTQIQSGVKGNAAKYILIWDSTNQALDAADSKVIPVTLSADKTAVGTKLLKLRIVEIDEFGTALEGDYATKVFFVRFD